MQSLKVKKAPIILPLVALFVLLAGYTVYCFSGTSAADEITLGQQHLNDMDYTQAISVFTKAVSADPNNSEARLGLSQAYMGAEQYTEAEEMLTPMVQTSQPNDQAANQLVELYKKTEQLNQAIEVLQQMINKHDRDEDYQQRDELLEELGRYPTRFAQGYGREFIIRDGKLYGKVYSEGENSVGQLGLDPTVPIEANRYVDVGFSGKAVKVAVFGRTTFVVADDGTLWTAGENRWGQKAAGTADLTVKPGWSQVVCPGNVSQIAGSTGRLLVLLDDGTVWTAGLESGHELQRLQQFVTVMQLEYGNDCVMALDANGKLYQSMNNEPSQWTLYASDVASFRITGDHTITWIGMDGEIHSNAMLWYPSDEPHVIGSQPSFGIKEALPLFGGIMVLTTDDRLLINWEDQNTGVSEFEEINCPKGILSMRNTVMDRVVLEYKDNAQVYDLKSGTLGPL